MPKYKAHLIPDWVSAIKKGQKLEDTMFNYLPAMMHWRSAGWMYSQLNSFTPSVGARKQLHEVVTHLMELLKKENVDTENLVAQVVPMMNIPYQLMVTFSPDVDKPPVTGQLILRVDIHGDIVGVEREYTMNYTTDKS